MKFTVDYPIVVRGYDPQLVRRDGMARVAAAVEELGYDALAFSEHPAPSAKWLAAGGHESLHQLAALAFCAAFTERVRLMTLLMVVPYHNPFLAAKGLATVDLLSGGRVTVVAGTGYLRSEFLAMGVPMEDRNERFDEAIEVMRGAWTEVPFDHAGTHFSARGVASMPLPLQAGGPPIMVGGNSGRARDRASRLAGWSPIMVSPEVARTSRTPGISSVEQLQAQIREVRDAAARHQGADAPIEVQVLTPQVRFIQEWGSVEQHREHLAELAEAGVDSFVVRPPGDTVARTLESLQQYAETFFA